MLFTGLPNLKRCGTAEGKVMFLQSTLKRLKKVSNLIHQGHKKPVSLLKCNQNYLISVSEDSHLIVWTLTSCSKRHEIQLKNQIVIDHLQNNISQHFLTGLYFPQSSEDLAIVQNEKGDIIEIDLSDARVNSVSQNLGENFKCVFSDSGNRVAVLSQNFQLQIYEVTKKQKEVVQQKKLHVHLAYFISQFSNNHQESIENPSKQSISTDSPDLRKNIGSQAKRGAVNIKKLSSQIH